MAVDALNISYKDRKNPKVLGDIGIRAKDADVRLGLALFLVKLYSRSRVAIVWARGHTKGMDDVA